MISSSLKDGKSVIVLGVYMTKENFQVYPLIDKKKKGQRLTDKEIKWFIQGYTDKKIEDYQVHIQNSRISIKIPPASAGLHMIRIVLDDGRIITRKIMIL